MSWSRDLANHWNVSDAALANLSQALALTQAEVEDAVRFQGSDLKQIIIDAGLQTMFLGLFTVFTGIAVHVLFSKGIKRTATAMMLIAIMVMWATTVAYWIATVVVTAQQYIALQDFTKGNLARIVEMRACLDSLAGSDIAVPHCQERLVSAQVVSDSNKAYGIQACTGTLALTVNVLTGDSIVWWRAWVLWPNRRIIRWICVLIFIANSVLGAMDTVSACVLDTRHYPGGIASIGVILPGGTIFSGDGWGIFGTMCELLTNIVATSLIAYRAWEHRRAIMSYLRVSSPRGTQVERTLALLVESGALYCALWVMLVVYAWLYGMPTREASAFVYGFQFVLVGCVVPLIGMYPTLVIILCAFEKSLHEASANEQAQNASMPVFNDGPVRRRGTLSELLSPTIAYASQEDIQSSSYPPPRILDNSSNECCGSVIPMCSYRMQLGQPEHSDDEKDR